MDYAFSILLLLFAVALVAGFIDAIAGGGGLITIPVLLALGVNPILALGTNKLQSTGGSFSASWYFIRKRQINIKQIYPLIIFTFIGAALGAIVVQGINVSFLNVFLPFMIIAIGLYFLLMPNIGEQERKPHISLLVFALTVCPLIGFYDAVFGPATGSFFNLAFILLLGFNLIKSTANAKILNFTSNFAALIFFVIHGNVIWELGIVMLVGQVIGAQIGASMVILKGRKLIKPMIVIVSFLISIKMLIEIYF